MNYEELLELTDKGVEIWKPINGYEGYYEISNLGRVKSIERWVRQGNKIRHVKENIKKIHIGAYGYSAVSLCKDGKSIDIPVHRLLAKTFIPNPDNKTAIDHINTIKTDYSLKNLQWVTPKENANNPLTLIHCKENTYSEESLNKRLDTRKVRNTATSPKTVYQYTQEGKFVAEYCSLLEAERQTGVNHNSIHRVLNDCTLSAGKFLWTDKMVENLKYAKKQNSKIKAVQQYDLQGRLIAEWDSISLASKQLGIPVGNIVRNIKSTIVRKYRFKYK